MLASQRRVVNRCSSHFARAPIQIKPLRLAPIAAASAPSSMSTYKLVYFDIRGLAEVPRFIFAVAGKEYQDARLSFSFGTPGDFSTIKRPEFDAAKASGELDVSCGKVPYLEVDGKKIGQSKAIERFLAGQFGLMGGSPIEAAQVDQLCESVRDIKDAYGKVRAVTDPDAKATAMAKWFAEDLPKTLLIVEKSVPAGAGPFLVGSSISLADINFYHLLLSPGGYFDNAEAAKAAFQACPRIKAAVEAVDKNAGLQAWLAKRPASMF